MTTPTPQPASHQRANKRVVTIVVVLGLLILQGGLVMLFLRLDDQRQETQVVRFPSRALHSQPSRDTPNTPSPEMDLQPLQGSPVALSAFRTDGKPTLLHFWATWDTKSRQSLPILSKIAERYDVHLVAVAVDASWGQIAGVTEQPIPSWVMLPHTATYVDDFGIKALPETWLIGSQGTTLVRWKGHHTWRSDVARDDLAVQLRRARSSTPTVP